MTELRWADFGSGFSDGLEWQLRVRGCRPAPDDLRAIASAIQMRADLEDQIDRLNDESERKP